MGGRAGTRHWGCVPASPESVLPTHRGIWQTPPQKAGRAPRLVRVKPPAAWSEGSASKASLLCLITVLFRVTPRIRQMKEKASGRTAFTKGVVIPFNSPTPTFAPSSSIHCVTEGELLILSEPQLLRDNNNNNTDPQGAVRVKYQHSESTLNRASYISTVKSISFLSSTSLHPTCGTQLLQHTGS